MWTEKGDDSHGVRTKVWGNPKTAEGGYQQKRRRYVQIAHMMTIVVSKIYRELLELSKKTNNPIQKDLIDICPNIQIANKHMKNTEHRVSLGKSKSKAQWDTVSHYEHS